MHLEHFDATDLLFTLDSHIAIQASRSPKHGETASLNSQWAVAKETALNPNTPQSRINLHEFPKASGWCSDI